MYGVPGALEFYLNESARPGSPLAGLSIPKALRVSSLAEQSGKGGFLLDYVARYGADPVAMKALLNTSPETLNFYTQQTAAPNSPLARFTPAQGLRLSALSKTYGNETLLRFLARSEKFGVDPTAVLEKPPKAGQTLEGWMLGVTDPKSPVNQPLKFNLSEVEMAQLFKESVHNPKSRLFAIGFYDGADIPYTDFATHFGDPYQMSYFSAPDAMWTKFKGAGAYGDFWQGNSAAIEWGIQERKIFILNVSKTIADRRTSTYTFAEMKLLGLPESNYIRVPLKGGEYEAFIPAELIDQYDYYLPPALRP